MKLAYNIVQSVYDAVLRDHLPRKMVAYGDIPVRDGRLFDATDRIHPYKPGLERAIREHVDGGEATLIGGGRGISSVWLAQEGASVTAYEAAEEMVSFAEETLKMKGQRENVTIRHALVGEGIEVFGSADNAEILSPVELETGDILVMDCEGAEKSILEGLADLPQRIIVETHPGCGVSTAKTRALLNGRGYIVTGLEYHPDYPDKRVLVGEFDG